MKLGDIDRTFNSIFRQIGNINIELNKLRVRMAGLQPSAQQTSLSDQGSSYCGYIYVPLLNSLIHPSLDGDALAVGTYTVGPIGSGATFQFDYPSIVRAVHVRIVARWDNAISGGWAFVAPAGANYAQVAVHYVVAGRWGDNSGIVSTDTSGRFNLTVAGENATSIWFLITGYFL